MSASVKSGQLLAWRCLRFGQFIRTVEIAEFWTTRPNWTWTRLLRQVVRLEHEIVGVLLIGLSLNSTVKTLRLWHLFRNLDMSNSSVLLNAKMVSSWNFNFKRFILKSFEGSFDNKLVCPLIKNMAVKFCQKNFSNTKQKKCQIKENPIASYIKFTKCALAEGNFSLLWVIKIWSQFYIRNFILKQLFSNSLTAHYNNSITI